MKNEAFFPASLCNWNTPIDYNIVKTPMDEEYDDGDSICEFLTDSDGREIQKISLLRNFPELMESHPRDCTIRVLPVIQATLKESKSFDLHCEGALAYRDILISRRTNIFPDHLGLAQEILKGVRANLETTNLDQYSNAAWLETLLDIIDQVALDPVKDEVLPIVVHQSQYNRPIKTRVGACKLIEKLAPKLDPQDVKATIVPCVQSLCQDLSMFVRTAMCDRLHVLGKVLSPLDFKSHILPLLIELCSDEDPTVQDNALDAIRNSVEHFEQETICDTIFPLFRKSAEKAFQIGDTSLAIIAKNYGQWCLSLSDSIKPEQKTWLLSFFRRLSQVGRMRSASELNIMTRSDPDGFSLQNSLDADPVHTACRDWAAYNFPGMVYIFGAQAFATDLESVFIRLCKDPEDGVRKTVAGGYHAIVKLLEAENRKSMIDCFLELVRSGDAEVVSKLTPHFGVVLPILYSTAAKTPPDSTPTPLLDTNGNNLNQRKIQIDRMLLACNRLIRHHANWRGHEAYLQQLACLRLCETTSQEDLYTTFVPMLKEEALTARAIPCRVAAGRTLLLFLKEFTSKTQRTAIIDFFTETLGKHQSCPKRMLFLDVVNEVLDIFSRQFFKDFFFFAALKLTDDRVSNVRLKAVSMLPKFKATLVLPTDQNLLIALENAFKHLLQKEDNMRHLETIQRAACLLSGTEAADPSDVSDVVKVEEERVKFEEAPKAPKRSKSKAGKEGTPPKQQSSPSIQAEQPEPVKDALSTNEEAEPVPKVLKPDELKKSATEKPKHAVAPQPTVEKPAEEIQTTDVKPNAADEVKKDIKPAGKPKQEVAPQPPRKTKVEDSALEIKKKVDETTEVVKQDVKNNNAKKSEPAQSVQTTKKEVEPEVQKKPEPQSEQTIKQEPKPEAIQSEKAVDKPAALKGELKQVELSSVIEQPTEPEPKPPQRREHRENKAQPAEKTKPGTTTTVQQEQTTVNQRQTTLNQKQSEVKMEEKTVKKEESTLKKEQSTVKKEETSIKQEQTTLKNRQTTVKKEQTTVKQEQTAVKQEQVTVKQKQTNVKQGQTAALALNKKVETELMVEIAKPATASEKLSTKISTVIKTEVSSNKTSVSATVPKLSKNIASPKSQAVAPKSLTDAKEEKSSINATVVNKPPPATTQKAATKTAVGQAAAPKPRTLTKPRESPDAKPSLPEITVSDPTKQLPKDETVASKPSAAIPAVENSSDSKPRSAPKDDMAGPNSPQLKIRRPRTAIVRPQPKVLMTRTPSPRPDDDEVHKALVKPKQEIPPVEPTGRTVFSTSLVNNSSSITIKKSTSSTKVAPAERMTKSEEARTLLKRTTQQGRRLVGTGNLKLTDDKRPIADLPQAPPRRRLSRVQEMMQKWEASQFSAGSSVTAPVFDQNGNASGKTNIPIASNMIRRGSLQGAQIKTRSSEINTKMVEQTNESLESPNVGLKSYGLMKVQSASAISTQRSSSVVSLRSRRKF